MKKLITLFLVALFAQSAFAGYDCAISKDRKYCQDKGCHKLMGAYCQAELSSVSPFAAVGSNETITIKMKCQDMSDIDNLGRMGIDVSSYEVVSCTCIQ